MVSDRVRCDCHGTSIARSTRLDPRLQTFCEPNINMKANLLPVWCLVLAAAAAAFAAVRREQGPPGPPGTQGSPGLPGPTSVPVGMVVAWPVDHNLCPEGWHVCDGASLSATDYPELARILGGTYGAVGPGQVNLPDFRGYFLRGKDEGWQLGVPQPDSVRAHSHTIKTKYIEAQTARVQGASLITGLDDPSLEITNVETQESGGTETRPVNYSVHWIIRIK